MRHFFTLLLLIVSASLQATPDTLLIRRQYERALLLIQVDKDWKTAEWLAQKTLQAVRSTPGELSPEMEGKLLNVLGDCALEATQYHKAIRYYEEALEKWQRRGNALGEAETLNKIGNYYQEVKAFDEAYPYFENALRIREQALGDQHLKVAHVYNNIGNCLNNLGDFSQALVYYDQALSIRTEKLTAPHAEIAQTYNNRGLCWKNQGKEMLALTDFEKALSIYQQLYGSAHPTVGDVHFNLGNIYDAIGSFAHSIQHYQKALKSYQTYADPNHPDLASCYSNMANVYAQKSGYDDYVAQLHQKALKIRIHNFGPVHPDVAESHYNIGGGHFMRGNFRAAADSFQNCLQALNFNSDAFVSFQEVNSFHILINALHTIAITHVQLYYQTNTNAPLEEALRYFLQADQFIDFLRIRYKTVGSKLQLAQKAAQVYEAAILPCLLLEEITGDIKYWEQAFFFSEKNRSLLLLEGINKSEAALFSGIPPRVTNRLQDMEKEIVRLEKRYFLESGHNQTLYATRLDSLAKIIFDRKQKLSKLIDSVKIVYPDYYTLRYENAPIPLEEIQKKLLKPEQTILEYFLGNDRVYIFVITKNQFEVVNVSLPPNFDYSVFSIRDAILNFPYISSKELTANIQRYQKAAHEIYQVLIEPVKSLIKSDLVIIPSGELELLPFDALLSGYSEELTSLQKLPFLIKNYTITYNYSVRLLKEMTERKRNRARKIYLGFAPVFSKENDRGLSPLLHNEQEILDVQQAIGGDVFLNTAATRSNFITQQSHYQILHLATHGKVNNNEKDYSFLAFSNEKEGPEQSLLYIKDIYNLSIHAEMIVLSACETGTGELQRGEGIASIARSFSYAGAKSLVATLWNIDDKVTSQIMLQFFENLKQGQPKNHAIRKAKLVFLVNAGNRYAHPFYWASFISIGNMEPLPLKSSNFGWLWVVPLGLTSYLLYFWLKIKRMERRIFTNKSSV